MLVERETTSSSMSDGDRGCPPGTGLVRLMWHVGGTAGDNADARDVQNRDHALMSEEDEDVTAARYQQLNERFYTADPADYFRTRLSTLALVAGRPGDLLDLLKEGVEYGRIWAKADSDEEVDAAGVDRYVTIESQILLHHVAEALIRLFFAHVDSPPCPWFELSAETDFGGFKRRVEDQLVKARRRRALEEEAAFVLLGRRSPRPDEDAARWNDATENLARFLRVYAGRWLKDSHVFNAMKHGLAVIPGDALFQIVDDDGRAIRLGEGTSVEFLEAKEWEKDHGGRRTRRVWQTTTRWLDIQESLGLVQIGALMIDSLWLVAKHRYLEGDGEGRLFFPAGLKPDDLRGPRSPVHTFSWRFLEERPRQ